jgi:hypothetical protein
MRPWLGRDTHFFRFSQGADAPRSSRDRETQKARVLLTDRRSSAHGTIVGADLVERDDPLLVHGLSHQ